MTKYRLTYTTHARNDLERLDKNIALRIVVKIKENSELSNPLVRATALAGQLAGRYRYRIGTYRAIMAI
jgi:mRNA interferase RelE/StbE